MPWKQTVNATIRRVSGYHLTKEDPEDRRRVIDAAVKRESTRYEKRAAEERQRETRRLEEQRQRRRAQRDARRASQRESGTGLPHHFDDSKRATVTRVRDWTMTQTGKLDSLIEATRYVTRHGIPGDVVECGVWRGGSMQAVALTLLESDDESRELHLFDTFEGMPPPTAEDGRTRDGSFTSADELLASHDRQSYMWAAAGLDLVKEGMSGTRYPADKIHYHVGLVEETTPSEAPAQIAILRLDTDWYSSTKHELEHLFPRLSPGGVLIIDDYNAWDGAQKAVDEWLAASGLVLFLMPMGGGRIAIKPFK